MLIHAATAPVWPFFLPMAWVPLVFLAVVVAFAVSNGVVQITDGLTRTGFRWIVSAILAFALDVWLLVHDVLTGAWFSGPLLDIVAFILLTIIVIVIAIKMVMTFKKPFEGHWGVSWLGFLIIGLSVWLWDGIFRLFGQQMLDLFQTNFLPTATIASIVMYIGVGVMVLGWIIGWVGDAVQQYRGRKAEATRLAAQASR